MINAQIFRVGLAAIAVVIIGAVVNAHVHTFTVEGTSMLPELQPGDEAICAVTNDYEIGDTIVFKAKDTVISIEEDEREFKREALIAHKIIDEWDFNRYTTQGINAENRDPRLVDDEDIICEVVAVFQPPK